MAWRIRSSSTWATIPAGASTTRPSRPGQVLGLRRPGRRAAGTAHAPAMKLRIDMTACEARGFCAELLPELISLDDWGFPIISSKVPVDGWRCG
jgi:hypothetical protein